MSHWKQIMNEDTHGLFRFFNTKNAQKYQNFYLATEVEHDQSSYFCRGPDDFCWGPAPVGPTLVTGPHDLTIDKSTNGHYGLSGSEVIWYRQQ